MPNTNSRALHGNDLLKLFIRVMARSDNWPKEDVDLANLSEIAALARDLYSGNQQVDLEPISNSDFEIAIGIVDMSERQCEE